MNREALQKEFQYSLKIWLMSMLLLIPASLLIDLFEGKTAWTILVYWLGNIQAARLAIASTMITAVVSALLWLAGGYFDKWNKTFTGLWIILNFGVLYPAVVWAVLLKVFVEKG